MIIVSPLLDMIKKVQVEGFKRENWKEESIWFHILLFVRDYRGLLTQCGRFWLPVSGGIRQTLLEEAHKSKFSIHQGATKMYKYLILSCWWTCMKREIACFVERCFSCRKVKAKYQRPSGKMQPLSIPIWKWEDITMDFIIQLSRTT